jgi:hypothetical protein
MGRVVQGAATLRRTSESTAAADAAPGENDWFQCARTAGYALPLAGPSIVE